jgi:hypothetical protein
MESCTKETKLKLSAVLIFKNQNLSPFEDGFTTILLDNSEVPSIITTGTPEWGVSEGLNNLLSEYVKFHISFLKGQLVDYYEKDGLLELIFCFSMIFIPGVISKGSLFSRQDLADRKIQLHERYRKYIQ